MSVLVAQLGARRHYAVPSALYSKGLLTRFCTDFYIRNDSIVRKLQSIVPKGSKVFRLIERAATRNCPRLPDNLVDPQIITGLTYALRRSISGANDIHSVYIEFGEKFNSNILLSRSDNTKVVYGFNSATLGLARVAKSLDKRVILDQSIAPISEPMIDRYIKTSEPGVIERFRDLLVRSQALQKIETEEWRLADRIVCGSDFVKDCLILAGAPSEKCFVIPSGILLNQSTFVPRHIGIDRPIKVLFVGTVSDRKGIPLILEAAKILGSYVQINIVGPLGGIDSDQLSGHSNIDYKGSVPRNLVDYYYDSADVLLLPSYFEGSAMVIYEALAKGLLVICTENSGPPPSPSVITIPAGDAQAIVTVLSRFICGESSFQTNYKNIEAIDFGIYAERLASLVRSVL